MDILDDMGVSKLSANVFFLLKRTTPLTVGINHVSKTSHACL